jgi:hypothetical protein
LSHCTFASTAGTLSVPITGVANTVIAIIAIGGQSFAVAVSPDGHLLYVANTATAR